VEQAAKLIIDPMEGLRRIRAHWMSRTVHDFRGPLFSARGYTKLALDSLPPDVTVTQRRYLESALDSMNKLNGLVDLLHLFPSESSLHLEAVDLSKLLRTILNDWKGRSKTLRILETIPVQPVVTIADRGKLSASVHKFLAAAVEFSQSEGEIQLNSRHEDGELTIRLRSRGPNSQDQPPSGQTPDIAMACDAFRIHGGTANADVSPEGFLYITCRLPIISLDAD